MKTDSEHRPLLYLLYQVTAAMPTNLPAEYQKIEARYKAAESNSEKIRLLEELISVVPKHKGTDKLRADLRRRLSKLRSSAQDKKSVGRHDSEFHVDREGAGMVMVVGHANTGKSSLIRALTHAEPEVADYPFSTWHITPGMMTAHDVQIQLIDTPPLDRDYNENELFDLIRRSDLILLLADIKAFPLDQIEQTALLLERHRISPPHGQEQHEDQLRNVFIPMLVVVNKVDDAAATDEFTVLEELLGSAWELLPISILQTHNLELLRQRIYDCLDIMRVFSKPPGKPPDFSAPYVLPRGSTVETFAGHEHRDFLDHFKYARIWGHGVFDGQPVGRDHVLHDGDVVELKR